ncbi:MAG: ribbon-helix-helix protein, CopG family [Spirochaeta sp.]|jgi:predicted transcriptional regulator|nr:ribbon-helix-helix protein, CopG family [Spirochaeta sp.]
MSSTTVHIPDEILQRVDAIARRRGVSRNRVVLASLEAEIERDSGEWPDAFFAAPSAEEREILTEAAEELEASTVSRRRNRGAVVL